MVKPQQPELARSGRGEVDPNAVKTRHGGPTDTTAAPGPVPEDNQPGHHPEHEQDKPDVKPRAPRGRRAPDPPAPARTKPQRQSQPQEQPHRPARRSFAFDFEPAMAAAGLPFGVTPFTTSLEVVDDELRVRFGPWSVRTPLANVVGAEMTGPYSFAKVAGPAHLSFKDRGLTFATSTKRGVCIRFREPVTGISPFGLIKHPALTVTVSPAEELVHALTSAVPEAR